MSIGMETTVPKAKILKFLQIKLNQVQQKSSLFQCKVSNMQYLSIINYAAVGIHEKQRVILCYSFSTMYGELHVIQELF